MDIVINILESFPSIEKLIKNDNIILEINDNEYNLKKIIDNNELIKLHKITSRIIFKIYLTKKELYGINIFRIEKLKELFSLDGKSYILWLEFKKENKNDNYNLMFYHSIKLKIKFIPIIQNKSSTNNNKNKISEDDNNSKTISDNMYNNKIIKNNINENNNLTESNDIYCISSSNFYKNNYEEEYFNNIKEDIKSDIKIKNQRLKNSKQEDIKNKLKSIPTVNNISSKNNTNFFNKQKNKKSNQKKISNKTSNIIKTEDNYILTENNYTLKYSKNINKSLSKANTTTLDKNNDHIKICKKYKTPSKIKYIKREVSEIKKAKSTNNYKISDDDINSTIINTNQNNLQNVFSSLSKSYNKNYFMNKDFSIRNKNKSREQQLNIKQNININHFNNTSSKNSYIENRNSFNDKKNKLNSISKPILDKNNIKDNHKYEKEQLKNTSRYENKYNNSFKKDNDKITKSVKSKLNELMTLKEINKKDIEDNMESHNNTQLINNISITNNSINDNNISLSNNNIYIEDDYKDNFLLNSLYYNENETFEEFNSLRNNFELFYSKSFINNIKKDLIDLEFNLALEKIMGLFTCYNNDVEYLYFKNIILRNAIKNLETKMKYIRKKLYKLNCKKEELNSRQNRLILIKESQFYFNEDIKMQKLIQKKILENLIKNRFTQKQKLTLIFKELFKKRPELFNLKNKENKVNVNNNINNKINNNMNNTNMNNINIKTNSERVVFNKVYQIYENQKLINNLNNRNNLNTYDKNQTPKIKKNKKYKMNSMTENRNPEIKINKFFSPPKPFSKGIFNKHILKTNAPYFTNGNFMSSHKNKYY